MRKRLLAVVAVLAVLAGCTPVPAPGDPGPSGSATPSQTPTPTPTVATLEIGDCTGPLSPGSTDVQQVDCDSEHSWEVFGLVDVTTQTLPDDTLFKSLATTGCVPAFTSYVGVEPEHSRYSSVYIPPSTAAWEDPAQRHIVCLAGLAAGGLTGSVKGDSKLFPDVGECTGPQDVPLLELALIDCKQEHDYEVYAEKKLDSKKAPTAKELQKLLKDVCVAQFTKFVGVDLASSKYEYSYFIANADTWTKVADHRLVCSVGSPKGGVEGSLKGVKK
ncbi:MAG: septum formation family protein [Propionicimonas sp.]|uniref:septum formation family protein n=1 Tax=Propionicimonas sp. TaxID=1955623 RepID=UPI002B1F087E|nr:septum formation family protein [Propionicimonas sp.]MEA4944485.1 septum formation family protein [Propionicimonas sp.]MEA5053066.1 septum formation family protein [Propionicimonas sp.]MEA5116310.1 septum formation family protein [Propionicimonas sp.]